MWCCTWKRVYLPIAHETFRTREEAENRCGHMLIIELGWSLLVPGVKFEVSPTVSECGI